MPTEAEIAERLVKLVAELKKKAPGYRLQTAPEFWDSICLEKTGETFAVPAAFREFVVPDPMQPN